MKRYAIYRRVSTDEQSRPGHVSLEAQTAECRRLVIEHGGVVVLEEQDVQSGLDPSRPGYQRLRDAARRGEIDAVVCFRFDRWGRNAGEAITSFTDLQSIGVTVESVMEPSEDIFLKSLFSLLGFRESQAISQRTLSGLRTRARRGEWSGHPPIGYIIHRDNGRSVLAIDPLKAPAIRQLFEDAATGRYSLAQLADAAMAAGLRGPNGHPLSRQYVGRLLRNPTYVGALVYGRTSNGKFAKRGKQPTDTWIKTPDAHPALVDQSTFTSVQMHLTRHRNEQGSIRRTRFLLTSVAYCGRCAGVPGPDGKARAWRVYGHGTKSPGYQCSRRSMYGLCDLPNLGAISIELAVRQRIMRAFTFTPEVRQEAAAFIAAEIGERRSTVEQQRRN